MRGKRRGVGSRAAKGRDPNRRSDRGGGHRAGEAAREVSKLGKDEEGVKGRCTHASPWGRFVGRHPQGGELCAAGPLEKYEEHFSGDPALPHLAGQSGMCRQYDYTPCFVVTHLRNRLRGARSHSCCHCEGPRRSTGDCTRNSAFQARVRRTLRKLSGTV